VRVLASPEIMESMIPSRSQSWEQVLSTLRASRLQVLANPESSPSRSQSRDDLMVNPALFAMDVAFEGAQNRNPSNRRIRQGGGRGGQQGLDVVRLEESKEEDSGLQPPRQHPQKIISKTAPNFGVVDEGEEAIFHVAGSIPVAEDHFAQAFREEQPVQCVVCQYDIEPEQVYRSQNIGCDKGAHSLHEECAEGWRKQRRFQNFPVACPVCRVPEDQADGNDNRGVDVPTLIEQQFGLSLRQRERPLNRRARSAHRVDNPANGEMAQIVSLFVTGRHGDVGDGSGRLR